MIALSLPFDPPSETRGRKKSGHVRATSVAVAHALRGHIEGRAKEVLAWLEWFTDTKGHAPTSAELAQQAPFAMAETQTDGRAFNSWADVLLYTRRGISDLQVKGFVEAVPNGRRYCDVSKRTCETWRVRQR